MSLKNEMIKKGTAINTDKKQKEIILQTKPTPP